ncbi:MAG TPA: menaquinone biosynthesis protein [Candidatus Sumerlaeota bacterium]|nr:menaquinone biosynthesis protein [Candidatus Sumerlaeota bacterium]HOR28772.1 menaquinone biosynthesis protein [Candidatus Sumerlaeota bacterium]HPK03487.1 menaquinone biosynthesis protein [Candidatus Sumerlaeota bacterium]
MSSHPEESIAVPPTGGLRVGVVAFLNMLPLVAGAERLAPGRLEIVPAPPSRLAQWLAEGRVDLAMAPVAALFEHPEWRIVGRSMIGADGDVLSVLVVGREPRERWSALRPDGQSRTSNVLARLVLERRLGLRLPLGEPLPRDVDWEPPADPRPGEAFVLIGDRALRWGNRWSTDAGGDRLDLGAHWKAWTGLPMVFAVWCARPGVVAGPWIEALEQLKELNRARLAELAAAWRRSGGDFLSPAEAENYLRQNLRFNLDAEALEGLRRFYAEGRSAGLFADGWVLRRL